MQSALNPIKRNVVPFALNYVSPVPMWLLIWGGILAWILLVPRFFVFEPNLLATFLFLLAVSNWSYFFPNSLLAHRKAALSVSQIDRVVKTGPYAIIRHPIYFSDIVLSWGIFFIFPTSVSLVCAAWVTLMIVGWSFLEERAMVSKFGKEYREYQRKVPMLIPRV